MVIVAVAGDACTTTSVALASAWPISDDTVLVEADPAGGDLGAWLDMSLAPSLSTVVTRVLDGAWPEIDRLTRLAGAGLRVIPAPSRSVEAAQAVAQSARTLVPTLAALRSPTFIADIGRLPVPPAANPFVTAASVIVMVHRQGTQSSRAAAVRLQRFVDQLHSVASTTPVVLAVVGAEPFDVEEVSRFVVDAIGEVPVVGLPVDPLSAAVFGGRTGVSERRLARLPLLRAARDLAVVAAWALERSADERRQVGR